MASASRAEARATLLSLRRQIASIEGQQAVITGDGPGWENADDARKRPFLKTGLTDFDRILGGGVALASLSEIHVREARDAGLAAGFAAALLSLAGAPSFLSRDPVLWIGGPGVFSEAGAPHGRGLQTLGFPPERLFLAEARKLADALWIAEEAAGTRGIAATVIEMRGHASAFGLRETQRLHRRAQVSGRPVLLLRQSAGPEPTAAPLRLRLSAAPSAPRVVLAGTAHARAVAGGIGPPGFSVTIEKNRAGPAGRTFLMHWNSHERHFSIEQPIEQPIGWPGRCSGPPAAPQSGAGAALIELAAAHHGADLSVSFDRPRRARTLGKGLAADAERAS